MYVWLEALHLAAVTTWMFGLIVAPVALKRTAGPQVAVLVRKQFRRVTTPAMVLALGLGLWLAYDGGWFSAGWLHAKLVLVFALTAIHGVLAGQLRRVSAVESQAAPAWVLHLSGVVIAAALAIAALMVVRPELR